MAGLDEILLGTDLNSYFPKWGRNLEHYVDPTDSLSHDAEEIIREGIEKKFRQARDDYKMSLTTYGQLEFQNSNDQIKSGLFEIRETVSAIADAVKATEYVITKAVDKLEANDEEVPAVILEHKSQVNGYSTLVNSHLVNLQQAEIKIKDGLANLGRTDELIAERTAYLKDLEDNPESSEVRGKEISWQQRQLAVAEAQKQLSDYFVRSPLAGVVGQLSVSAGGYVAEGALLAKIVSPHLELKAFMNELDIAKIKIGQSALVYVDALEEKVFSGEVVDIAYLGLANQGVVNYEVKIAASVPDEEARPGMSGWAEIIIDQKNKVPILPNSAVKKDEQGYFVRILVGVGRNQKVEVKRISVGLIDDEHTEIISGLNPDDLIILGDI